MTKPASKEAMNDLHSAVAQELKARIASGEASAADISNAIKFLKDNGVEALSVPGSAVESLARQFPVFDDEDATDAARH